MTSKSIRFLPANRLIKTKGSEESVLEVAIRNGVEIGHSCGGMGSCTTCRIFIENCAEELPARNEVEQEILEPRGFEAHERLACQLPPLDGLVVRIPTDLDGE